MTNNKENNTQFNAFMEKAYEVYTENLLEKPVLYDATHKPYTEWLDSKSWEEICDYADLFADKTATEVGDYYGGQLG